MGCSNSAKGHLFNNVDVVVKTKVRFSLKHFEISPFRPVYGFGINDVTPFGERGQ